MRHFNPSPLPMWNVKCNFTCNTLFRTVIVVTLSSIILFYSFISNDEQQLRNDINYDYDDYYFYDEYSSSSSGHLTRVLLENSTSPSNNISLTIQNPKTPPSSIINNKRQSPKQKKPELQLPTSYPYDGITYIPRGDTPCYARGVNFNGIPIATTVLQSQQLFIRRIRRVIRCSVELPIRPFPRSPEERGHFSNPGNARLVSRTHVNEVNRVILDNATDQWGLFGSTLYGLGRFCGRMGDYDFTTQALIRTAYIDLRSEEEGGVLTDEARSKLVWRLLTANGKKHMLDFPVCGLFMHHETENHILMIETSRYLTNQLIHRENFLADDAKLSFDNSVNGFREWMLRHLQQFFIDYFEEYNSKPYQAYTTLAICNLYAYAEDPAVKLAAEMLTDFTSAVFAVQSNGLRRMSPFRRQQRYKDSHVAFEKDGETARFALLAGNYKYLRGDDRPTKRFSDQFGANVGEEYNDHDKLPDHPLVESVEIVALEGTGVLSITFVYRDGAMNLHGRHPIEWWKFWIAPDVTTLTLEPEEYLTTVVAHAKGQQLAYVSFETSNGRSVQCGTPSDRRRAFEAPDGWHITGLRGNFDSEGGLRRIGAIFTPIDYIYENNNMVLPYGMGKMLNTAILGYRVPEIILDVMIRKDHNSYYQKLKHDGVEIYHSSKSYLLSAGGVFNYNFMYGSTEQHGWARPTTLMPSEDPSSDYRNWIHVLGHDNPMKRYNTCVARDFACGLNVVLPGVIPQRCVTSHGLGWRFVDLTKDGNCPLNFGFYVAVFVKETEGVDCPGKSKNFGFFQPLEADKMTFEDFMALVLEKNGHRGYSCNTINHYEKTNGELISFELYNKDKWKWNIVAIDRVVQERDIEKWGLAEGDIIKAGRDGRIEVENPFLRKRLVLDMTDPMNPKRFEQTIAVAKNEYESATYYTGEKNLERPHEQDHLEINGRNSDNTTFDEISETYGDDYETYQDLYTIYDESLEINNQNLQSHDENRT